MDRHLTVHGVRVPRFVYGTAWKEERTEALARAAIAAGFAGIDTANQRRHYVEALVGKAVAAAIVDGAVSRDDLFLQTKFTYARGQDHRLPYEPKAPLADQVAQSFASSLEHLGTDYLDSYVLHGPSSPYGLSDADWQVWRAIESLAEQGKTRLVGVSNVSLEQLVALSAGAKVAPAFVQNRCFASDGWDAEVRGYCRAHDIVYQGFSLLTANGREIARPLIARIADRVGRSPAQVVFRFALQVGMIPLTGTSSDRHMQEDLACFDFELTDAEVEAVQRIAK